VALETKFKYIEKRIMYSSVESEDSEKSIMNSRVESEDREKSIEELIYSVIL